MRCCCGRYSKSRELEKRPVSEKASCISWAREGPGPVLPVLSSARWIMGYLPKEGGRVNRWLGEGLRCGSSGGLMGE